MVYLRSVGKLYGSFTARRKAVRFALRDRKQDLQPAWSTVWKAAQKTPRERFPMYFLLCFTVLLKQLRRLCTGGFIFQVPPVSD